jgi:hypothetical protein
MPHPFLSLRHPCVNHAATFLSQAVNTGSALAAIAVYKADSLAWQVVLTQATAAQLGYQRRPVAAPGDAVKLLTRHRAAQQCSDCSQVTWVIGSAKLAHLAG